jgi:hypothetical protein
VPSTRRMIGNALADTLLPIFRRPMEDVVYETLDRRDVATRPEMRDYVDASVEPGVSLRVHELEEKVRALEARLAALEGKPKTRAKKRTR